jgi:hypothetical protein
MNIYNSQLEVSRETDQIKVYVLLSSAISDRPWKRILNCINTWISVGTSANRMDLYNRPCCSPTPKIKRE